MSTPIVNIEDQVVKSTPRKTRGPQRADITSQVFGKLVVVSPLPGSKWICMCVCGSTKVIRASNLIAGNTVSCGCHRKEITSVRSKTHGLSKSPLHAVWRAMVARCSNSEHPAYPYYGSRGISVEPRWLSFENFYEDMEPNYSYGLSLDRIDNDGNYGKENCRWATREEQARNTRSNRVITYRDQSKPLAEWCEVLEIGYQTTRARLNSGWTVEQAFELPRGSTLSYHKPQPQ